MRISDWSSDVCSSDLRDRRDNRGAPVLQKQEHHEEDEHERLDQGVHHLFYREAYERGGVVWKGNLDVGGEALGDRLHFGLDRVDRVERIGARSQLDAETGGRLAIVLGLEAVDFRA